MCLTSSGSTGAAAPTCMASNGAPVGYPLRPSPSEIIIIVREIGTNKQYQIMKVSNKPQNYKIACNCSSLSL